MISVDTHRKNRITLNNISIWMLYLMPLVDTFNGYLLKVNKISVLGTTYRLAYLTIILMCLFKGRPRKYDVYLAFDFVLFIAIQIIVSGSYWGDSVELTVKLFTPLFMSSLFEKLIHKNIITTDYVHKLMDWLAVVFPLTIIIPFVLGIGFSTYRGGVGYKAFYYATNEISFSVCVIIMYLWSRMLKNMSFKYMVLYIFNALCCIMIGSKVVAGALILFTFLLIWNNFIFVGKKVSPKRLLIVFSIIAGIVVVYNSFNSQVSAIVNRWITNQSIAETNIAFLTSHRNVYLQNGVELFKSKGFFYILFGWGLGGANNGMVNIEMDLFDILFSCGILGLLSVLFNYVVLIKRAKYRTKETILFLIISFVLSFFSGHIMFSGLGGMMLATMILYSISLNVSQNGYSFNKRHDKQVSLLI